MKVGDRVQITGGINEGRDGEILSGYPIEGLETTIYWFIGFEDGSSDIVQEELLDIIEYG